MTKHLVKSVSILVVLAFAACSADRGDEAPDKPRDTQTQIGEVQPNSSVNLSPADWPRNELDAYLAAVGGTPYDAALAAAGLPAARESGKRGLVAATFSAFAVHAGVKALDAGGNAMDALLTTALTQVALHMGGATSYAGGAGIIYFDAASGQVHRVMAAYASVLDEDDPMSIPSYGNPSGRAVLVPGFMAGIGAAHERFGRLPFGALFEPAIYLAEEGFVLSPFWAGFVLQREHVITRRPEGRALFVKEGGELMAAGDLVRQSELAGFLRRVADQGTNYMYEGPWAQKLVDIVREEGGKMSLNDLSGYRPVWTEMSPSEFHGYQVYASAPLAQKLDLAHLAGLRDLGHYSDTPEALYWLIKISRISDILPPHGHTEGLSAEQVAAFLPELDLSPENRYSRATTEKIWEAMNQPVWKELEALAHDKHMEQAEAIAKLTRDFAPRKVEKKSGAKSGGGTTTEEDKSRLNHTAGAVAIDAAGNMAVINHSVTSAVWGELGIFVEGVSVTDPGAFAQRALAELGPGRMMGTKRQGGTGACPVIVVKDNAPFYACGNVGASYDLVALQGLVNVLEYGIAVDQLVSLPMFRKNWPPGPPVRQPANDGFPADVITAVNAMGIDIEQAAEGERPSLGGNLVVGSVNPSTGLREGAVTRGDVSRAAFNGRVQAQE